MLTLLGRFTTPRCCRQSRSGAVPHRTWPLISTLLFIGLFGVFLAFLFNRTGQSVLATMLAHLSLNIMLAIGGVRLSSVVFWRILAGIYGALAVLATVTSRRRLSHIDHDRFVTLDEDSC